VCVRSSECERLFGDIFGETVGKLLAFGDQYFAHASQLRRRPSW
jgi:hypothetical protein